MEGVPAEKEPSPLTMVQGKRPAGNREHRRVREGEVEGRRTVTGLGGGAGREGDGGEGEGGGAHG